MAAIHIINVGILLELNEKEVQQCILKRLRILKEIEIIIYIRQSYRSTEQNVI